MTKLIFCFDGTSNDPADSNDAVRDGSVSNILKMHALFGGSAKENGKENSLTVGQRSFYYSGIGTYGNWWRKRINAALAPRDGDMKEILEKATADLNKTFQEGDEVYIFGFSRGAAIARIFSAEINSENKSTDKTTFLGFICNLIAAIVRIFSAKTNSENKSAKKIKFLGVFDTVAAIRGSRDLNSDTYPASCILFEDGNMGEHIERAVHLVAIDEKRKMFQPTLFNKDERVEEVWFAGVHSDVGGSYWHDGLSDITLKFMMDKCEEAGLQKLSEADINYEHENLCRDDVEIYPMPHGELHAQQRPGKIAKLTLDSRKVRVNVDDEISEKDLPIVHHTVLERFRKVASYRPAALRDAKYQVMQENGECESAPRHGIADMREKSQ